MLSFLCNSRESVPVGEGEGDASLLGNRCTLNFPHIFENSTGATQEDSGVPYRIHRPAYIVFSVDGHLSSVNAIAVLRSLALRGYRHMARNQNQWQNRKGA